MTLPNRQVRGMELVKNVERRQTGYIRGAFDWNSVNDYEYNKKFKELIINNYFSDGIETHFPKLDEKLGGGLHAGLYVIGGLSSLGKTSFVMQLADQLVSGTCVFKNYKKYVDAINYNPVEDRNAGIPENEIVNKSNEYINIIDNEREHHKTCPYVMIFSLEMSRYELIAKSISRLTYDLCANERQAKTSRNIMNYEKYSNYPEEDRQLIENAHYVYGLYADRKYVIEGTGDMGVHDIRRILSDFIAKKNQKPVVIVDYLQILKSIDPHFTDKRNMDLIVTELRKMSKDLRIPVIVISALNRASYSEKISMAAFKESGQIEYSADVLIGLQFRGAGNGNSNNKLDVDEAKKKDPREIEAIILKNRYGETGATLEYEYRAKFNSFKEKGEKAGK